MKDQDKITSSLEVLKSSRERIQNINSWCQGEFAIDAKGERCSVFSPEATKWSALGSIWVSLRTCVPTTDVMFPQLWEEESRFQGVVYDFCSGFLDSQSLVLYKAFGIDKIEDSGLQIEAINDIGPFMKPREAVHKMILTVYDSCIKYCDDQLEMRKMLFK